MSSAIVKASYFVGIAFNFVEK